MSSNTARSQGEGLTLRQAALIAGIGLLIMVATTPAAEFLVYPKLVVRGDPTQTAQNIIAHQGLFIAGIFGYLITFICDLLVAWALYVLLVPVNRALSVLTAWFRVVYAAIGIFALLKLVTAYRLLTTPDYLTVFGAAPLNAQVKLLLDSFRIEWSMSLVLFGIHLVLLGYLIYRSGYIPRIIGILLAIDGVAWMIGSVRPYLFPNAPLGFLFVAYFAELIFMLWLLIRGWKIEEPIPVASVAQDRPA